MMQRKIKKIKEEHNIINDFIKNEMETMYQEKMDVGSKCNLCGMPTRMRRFLPTEYVDSISSKGCLVSRELSIKILEEKMNSKWEEIGDHTYRMEVPGGWIVRHTVGIGNSVGPGAGISTHMIFVSNHCVGLDSAVPWEID